MFYYLIKRDAKVWLCHKNILKQISRGRILNIARILQISLQRLGLNRHRIIFIIKR
jgi:hypothetical protein